MAGEVVTFSQFTSACCTSNCNIMRENPCT